MKHTLHQITLIERVNERIFSLTVSYQHINTQLPSTPLCLKTSIFKPNNKVCLWTKII